MKNWTRSELALFSFALEILADRMRHEPDEYADEERAALAALHARYIDATRNA